MRKVFSREAESLIASLRRLPEEDMPERDAGALRIGSAIEACVETHHIGKATPEEAVLENWERIVGWEFAKRCRPERIDSSGALVIAVSNATLRRELQFMQERILTALGSIPGCQHVHRVVLKSGT